ncbi:MAG: Mor transcription activator family protein [Rubrivivax sp.]
MSAAEQLALFDPADRPAGRAMRDAGAELPRLARELIDVMGEVPAMQLINVMGGLYLCVPGWPLKRASTRFNRLVEIVGEEAAIKYAERWGDIEIQVPKCAAAMRRVRDREIARRYDAAEPVQDICRRYDISERHFWRIVKKEL